MKIKFYILILSTLILPVTAPAMPPHPKLIDEWNKQGILNEKIHDYHLKSDSLMTGPLRSASVPQRTMPKTGSVKICVLLVDFNDASMDPGSDPAFYSTLLNGTLSATLQKYFYDMSNGKLTLQFEVWGPFHASKSHDYYGTDTAWIFPVFYKNTRPPSLRYIFTAMVAGFVIVTILISLRNKMKVIRPAAISILFISFFLIHLHGCSRSESSTSTPGIPVEGNDAHPAELVSEAIRAADNTVDFSQYSTDCIIVIHQGKGQEASWKSTDIWSHQWDLSSAKYYGDGTGPVTADGKTFNVYTIQPEYTFNPGDSSIGVFAHEMGHVLGLPDLYDTSSETAGVGDWSLMAGGSWCGPGSDGSRPAPLLAWERNKIGGTDWLTVSVITASQLNVPVEDIESGHIAYKITLNSATGQYLIIEGKNSGSLWTVAGSGILITHIHENIISKYTASNTVNAGYSRVHGVNIVEADGDNSLWEIPDEGESSDLFGGGQNQLTDSTNPDTKYYTSESVTSKTGTSNVSITGITTGTSPMTFDVSF